MVGMWWLLSREDRTHEGQRRTEPVLGSDPIAILCYSKTHFAAQFMKRGRTESGLQMYTSTQNNTSALSGYDAYFGTYEVDEQTGKVWHSLIGSVVPSNVGMRVSRNLTVEGDTLTIKLETTSQEGEPVIRTLTWKRMD